MLWKFSIFCLTHMLCRWKQKRKEKPSLTLLASDGASGDRMSKSESLVAGFLPSVKFISRRYFPRNLLTPWLIPTESCEWHPGSFSVWCRSTWGAMKITSTAFFPFFSPFSTLCDFSLIFPLLSIYFFHFLFPLSVFVPQSGASMARCSGNALWLACFHIWLVLSLIFMKNVFFLLICFVFLFLPKQTCRTIALLRHSVPYVCL